MKEWIKQTAPMILSCIISVIVVYVLSYFGLVEWSDYVVPLRIMGLVTILNVGAAQNAYALEKADALPEALSVLTKSFRIVSNIVIVLLPALAVFEGLIMKILLWGIE